MMARVGWLISDHVVSPPGSKLVLDHLVAAAVVARPARRTAPIYRHFSGCSLGQIKTHDCAKSQCRGALSKAWIQVVGKNSEITTINQPHIQGSLGGDQSTEQVCPRCSVQFSSVTQLCLTLCNSMNRSTLGLPVHHQLLEFTQTHVHQVGDAIQPSHPLSSPSPPAPSSSSLPAMSQLFA